ncbi:ABC transporter permease subunit [Sinorhizobium sp. RAC02]|uniref:ABC transporter permease n=1 Tax=Sinorhizobium sp. RAC02 TaxID=1842534 RepID=UPI00083DD7AA|nr:ABC transporter permease subunit [Sinorhizobium sp. RAC02]AOF93237.1 binding--dependent transport system inner membrane component family protein [Sinorhizobium sp. RAC02]
MTEQTARDEAIARFAGSNGAYYRQAFQRIGDRRGYTPSVNAAAVLLGPIWLGGRRLWSAFWPFLIADLLAVVVIAFALSGGASTEQGARAERLERLAATRLSEAKAANDRDSTSTIAKSLTRSATALEQAAREARQTAADAKAGASLILALGGGLLAATRLGLGAIANHLVECRFREWRLESDTAKSGFSPLHSAGAAALLAILIPIIALHFSDRTLLDAFPSDPAWNSAAAAWLDHVISSISATLAPAAGALTSAINGMLGLLEAALTETPWPVVMAIILAIAWQLAGFRVFLLTLVAISYLAILGYWEKSMQTVALLGTAVLISIAIGIPLGVLCGYNRRVAAIVRPLLDFMQTMPAFVYLIPVIALFGIGKSSGIIATVIFGIPPVVRLTALGIASVPPSVREAAIAFGASRSFILFKVDLPTAAPSIMAGISQTILMCLSMVVIAALIGAKGLGEDVLHALQYAAQGQGLLAGLAILLCAIVLDRMVQGRRADG